MKVGLLDTLGARYLRFWEPYLQDLGVELARPTLPKAEAYALGRESLAGEPPHIQLALGRILELGRMDAVLVPQPDAITGEPWSEAFAEILPRRVSSLPPLVSVPAAGDAALATELGTRLTHNPGVVRRALDRARPRLNAPRESMPGLTVASRHTIAVIGPEEVLAEPFVLGALPAELDQGGVHPVYSSELPRDLVLDRGLRSGAASPGERLLAGAQQALEGKSAVRGLLFVVPTSSNATRLVAQRLATRAHKPALVLEVSPERDDWTELHAFLDRAATGVRARPAGEDA